MEKGKIYIRGIVEDPKEGDIFILQLADDSCIRVLNKRPPEKWEESYRKNPSIFPQLTDDDFNNIAKALQHKSLSNDTKKILQEAFDDAMEWSTFDFNIFNAASRKKIERIGKAAKTLKDEISDYDFATFLFGVESLDTFKQLWVIEQKVKSKLKFYRIKQGRTKENLFLLTVIEQLAKTYKAITGKNPTLTKTPPTANRINKPSGAFYRFVSMFVAIIQKRIPNLEYYSEHTLVHLIEKIIYSRKSI